MLLIFSNKGVCRSQDVLVGHCVEKPRGRHSTRHRVLHRVLPSVCGGISTVVACFAYLDCRSTVSWQSRSKHWMPSPTVCCTRTVHTKLWSVLFGELLFAFQKNCASWQRGRFAKARGIPSGEMRRDFIQHLLPPVFRRAIQAPEY